MRGQRGITLVALVITIIVLLILAVVALGAVQDSKIIDHSQNAAGEYNAAKANEITTLNTSEKVVENILKNVGIVTK